MHIYIFTVFCLLNTTLAADILTLLWAQEEDEEQLLMRSLKGESLSVVQNKLMIKRLSNLPFTDYLKSSSWNRIVRYRSVKNMDVDDWQTYEPLIPYIPPAMLRQVNFSNPDILFYFGKQEFKQHQLSQLAEEVTAVLGDVLKDEENILLLGNIFCGFSPDELSKIEESTLRFLLEKKFFRSLNACTPQQLVALSDLTMKHMILGLPKTWTAATVREVGTLIAGLSVLQLREIPAHSFSEISPNIIDLIPAETLKQLRNLQVKHFPRKTLMSWRRKTQDLRDVNCSSRYSANISFVAVIIVLLQIR